MIDILYNKNGILSAVALHRGYIQIIEMYQRQINLGYENGHYYVRIYDHELWERNNVTFKTIEEAKKVFYSKSKELFGLSQSKTATWASHHEKEQ